MAVAVKPRQVGTVFEVPHKEIDRFPDQPRHYFSLVAIQRLADSIREDGQKDPVSLVPAYGKRKDGVKYFLVDGERRWRACGLIDRPLRAIIAPLSNANTKDHYLASAVANFHREGHTPMEIAKTVHRLMNEYKKTWAEVTRMTGMTEPTLRKYLDLMDLDPMLQFKFEPQAPRNERLPLSVGSELSRLPTDEQRQIIKEIKGKRTDVAREIIRRHCEKVEGDGKVVLRAKRGRRRRPSDDAEVVTSKVERILGDLGFLLREVGEVRLRTALAGRALGKNAGLAGLAEQICQEATAWRKMVESSLPVEVG